MLSEDLDRVLFCELIARSINSANVVKHGVELSCAVPISAGGKYCPGDCTLGPAYTDQLLTSCLANLRAIETVMLVLLS